MSRPLQRLVRSEILFREVNERVRETVGAFDGPLEFLCECSNEHCIDTVPLDLPEYERIRSHPNLFVVVPGHELPEVERIVDQGPDYLLVEKTADVEAVPRHDPRGV
jgi:hypothetical protein